MNAILAKIDQYVRARYPLVAIITHEEDRVIGLITKLMTDQRSDLTTWTPYSRVLTWAVTTGLIGSNDVSPDETRDPNAVISTLCEIPTDEPTLVFMKDYHHYTDNPVVSVACVTWQATTRPAGTRLS